MGEHPKTEEFTTQEYFETLIGMLNTPIGRRKNSEDVNKCVQALASTLQQGAKIIIPTR